MTSGPTGIEIACRLHEDALAVRAAGRPAEAEPLASLALEILECELGAAQPHHPDIANVLIVLAGIHEDLGDLEQAETLARRALSLLEDGHDPARIEGEPYARRSVEIREEALGPDHPDVAADKAALAAL